MMDRFDVVVVGGGVIGLKISEELLRLGLATCLIERHRCHELTSANSHRIIHGGLRYLQSLDFPRTLRSIQSLNSVLEEYPDCVEPLECALVLSGQGLKRPSVMRVAGLLYGMCVAAVSRAHLPSSVQTGHRVFGGSDIFRNFSRSPVFVWHDGLLKDPKRLALSLRESIVGLEGQILEHSEVTSVVKDPDGFMIRIRDQESVEVRSRAVVLALGPKFGTIPVSGVFEQENWAGRRTSPLEWAGAFNLVLKRDYCDGCAIGIPGENKRMLFFSPREQGTSAVGTWYYPIKQDAEAKLPDIGSSIVESALNEINCALGIPQALTQTDVIAVEWGILPMTGLVDGEPQLYGSDCVYQEEGLVEVLSTKYTVFPLLGRSIAQRIVEYLSE
ncbi:MAG: FAD-dependent oxidoreductase [Bdellovibrionales bacterium]|nr:FAD-dependent oxidoreductase [Bdellovibrionales bacterium]